MPRRHEDPTPGSIPRPATPGRAPRARTRANTGLRRARRRWRTKSRGAARRSASLEPDHVRHTVSRAGWHGAWRAHGGERGGPAARAMGGTPRPMRSSRRNESACAPSRWPGYLPRWVDAERRWFGVAVGARAGNALAQRGTARGAARTRGSERQRSVTAAPCFSRVRSHHCACGSERARRHGWNHRRARLAFDVRFRRPECAARKRVSGHSSLPRRPPRCRPRAAGQKHLRISVRPPKCQKLRPTAFYGSKLWLRRNSGTAWARLYISRSAEVDPGRLGARRVSRA